MKSEKVIETYVFHRMASLDSKQLRQVLGLCSREQAAAGR